MMYCLKFKEFKTLGECEMCNHNWVGGPCKYFRTMDETQDVLNSLQYCDSCMADDCFRCMVMSKIQWFIDTERKEVRE